jgi:HD-GYP domain-containing protein (c-di-GMP phosphodiesterase class II)/DNA-binding CsgD family transcriptional regulator
MGGVEARSMTALRLADLLAGLSLAADAGFGLRADEAVRSCVIAVHLARKLNLPNQEVATIFYTALLHHIGCTGFAHETSVLFGDEIAMNRAAAKTNFPDPRDVFKTFLPEVTRGRRGLDRARIIVSSVVGGDRFGKRFVTATCEVGRETARRIGLSAEVQKSLYHVYEWFNGKGAPNGLKAEGIPLTSRIVRVASMAAVFDRLGGKEFALDALRRRAGGLLDPALVLALATHANVLSEVNAGDPRTEVLHLEPEPVQFVPASDLPDVASAFGDVADLKSPFFHDHSRQVANLATDAGQRLGLGTEQVVELRVAASLHDLGRVSVSDAVWEKAGPLTSVEWENVRLHAYHSERILAASEALRPIAWLAGMHHERQDGSGYHRGLAGHSIPVSARILAASDVYVALTQERPHRPPRQPAAAADELRAEARRGRLDADVVACVLTAAGLAPRTRKPWPAELTKREVEVLRLVAKGLSNREIARQLLISRRTAEHHVQHVYDKIGMSSRAAVALFAMKHGILD